MATRKVHKLFSLLILIAVVCSSTAGALWWLSERKASEPVFDGPQASLRLALWHYDRAEGVSQKVKWAVAAQNAQPGWSADLPEHEVYLKKGADRFLEGVKEQVSGWESSLTRSEINIITEPHPNSIYRKAGRYRSIAVDCSSSDYDILRSQFTLEDLQEHAYLITQWIIQSEAPFEQEYSKRRLDLLRDENYWLQKDEAFNTPSAKANREIVTAWFSATSEAPLEHRLSPEQLLLARQASPLPDGNSITTSQAQSVNCERELESSGIEPDQIYEKAVNFAVAAPDCILGAHPAFVRMLRTEITVERGKTLLDKLAQWMGETGQETANFSDLPLDPSDLLTGSSSDAWGHEYIFRKEASGMLRVFSMGDNPLDRKSEIYIGEIQLPSPLSDGESE